MIDARFFQATYPWDLARDATLRTPQMAQMALLDPLARLNQQLTIESDRLSGHPGYDWQNPYVWYSRDVLTVSPLVPAYGIVGDTAQSVQRNIQRTQGAVLKI